ncbi:unnamed protein product [Dibothriocephalus latus]|uniref:Uncharacterized protein n=1 Tax=Dibothriocephalus latus TaxID=60516 RepID=A0A3P7LDZ0_DIBLA|nr:unnamed protein product [Dibothriocephalus latus]
MKRTLESWELETEVNCFWRELPPEEEGEAKKEEGERKSGQNTRCSPSAPSPPENLLSCQLARLASCLPLIWAAPNDPGSLAALRGKPGVRLLERVRVVGHFSVESQGWESGMCVSTASFKQPAWVDPSTHPHRPRNSTRLARSLFGSARIPDPFALFLSFSQASLPTLYHQVHIICAAGFKPENEQLARMSPIFKEM